MGCFMEENITKPSYHHIIHMILMVPSGERFKSKNDGKIPRCSWENSLFLCDDYVDVYDMGCLYIGMNMKIH